MREKNKSLEEWKTCALTDLVSHKYLIPYGWMEAVEEIIPMKIEISLLSTV